MEFVEYTQGQFVVRRFATQCLRLLRRSEGVTAVEYAAIVAFVMLVCISAINGLATSASNAFARTSAEIRSGGGKPSSPAGEPDGGARVRRMNRQ